jgi:hypothetical protein
MGKPLRKIIVIVAVLLFSVIWGAEISQAGDITLFNTGVDGSGALLSGGSIDPHYSIISITGDPLSSPPTNALNTFVATYGDSPVRIFWMDNGPSSNWISPYISANTDGGFSYFTYRTTFDLSGLDPNSAIISGAWSTDNIGFDILINGISTGNYIASRDPSYPGVFPPGFSFESLHAFSITNGFVTGINTLDFIVLNQGGATGFRVELSGTADPVAPVPKLSCVGFENPMNIGPVMVKKNRVLPLKAQLTDDGIIIVGTDIISPPIIQVLRGGNTVGGTTDVTSDSLPVGQGTEGNQFVFTSEGKWQFNLMTKNYSASGTYTIYILTGSSSEYAINPSCTATFVIK